MATLCVAWCLQTRTFDLTRPGFAGSRQFLLQHSAKNALAIILYQGKLYTEKIIWCYKPYDWMSTKSVVRAAIRSARLFFLKNVANVCRQFKYCNWMNFDFSKIYLDGIHQNRRQVDLELWRRNESYSLSGSSASYLQVHFFIIYLMDSSADNTLNSPHSEGETEAMASKQPETAAIHHQHQKSGWLSRQWTFPWLLDRHQQISVCEA